MLMRTVTLLRSIDIIDFLVVPMAVAVATMSVGVIVEQRQSNDVRQQTQTADDADKLGILHLLRLHQALYGLQENRQTQGDQENTIHEGTESFRALPLHVKRIRLEFVSSGAKTGVLPRKCTSWTSFRDSRP